LTKNISTFNPLRIATHEYASLGHDLRQTHRWRDRAALLIHGPGWSPTA
jgi:hypothetical protein